MSSTSEERWKSLNRAGEFVPPERIITVRVSQILHEKCKKLAAAKGMTLNTFCCQVLLNEVRKEPEQFVVGGVCQFKLPPGTEIMPGVPAPDIVTGVVMEIGEACVTVRDLDGNGLRLEKDWLVK